MKKIFYSIFAVAALAACSIQPIEPETPAAPFRIYLTTDTKAAFNEETYAVTWKDDEELHVLVNGTAYAFTKVAGEDYAFESATFAPEAGVTYNYEILTPFNPSYGEGVFTYSGGVKVTMYGKGTAVGTEIPTIQMEHLTAIIKTVIENTGELDLTVTSLRVESDTDNMGGRYSISDGVLTPVNPVKYTLMGSQNVAIKAGESKAMFVQCAPFTTSAGSKLTFTIEAGSDTFTIEKDFTASNAATFHAGKVKTTTVQIGKNAPEPETSDDVKISGTAVGAEAIALTKCVEKSGLYAYCGPLSEGNLEITLSEALAGTVTLANPYKINAADDYRVVVDTQAGSVSIELKSAKPNVQVSYNNTADKINPYTQDVTALYMYGGFNAWKYGTADVMPTLTQSPADPTVFTYLGEALKRDSNDLKVKEEDGTIVTKKIVGYCNFLVYYKANNVWAYGSTASAVRNSYNGYVSCALDTDYSAVGGQANNRYAYFLIPEGTNCVIVKLSSESNTAATVRFESR